MIKFFTFLLLIGWLSGYMYFFYDIKNGHHFTAIHPSVTKRFNKNEKRSEFVDSRVWVYCENFGNEFFVIKFNQQAKHLKTFMIVSRRATLSICYEWAKPYFFNPITFVRRERVSERERIIMHASYFIFIDCIETMIKKHKRFWIKIYGHRSSNLFLFYFNFLNKITVIFGK